MKLSEVFSGRPSLPQKDARPCANRTTGVEVIIIERFLARSLWHADSEFAARYLVAEEHIADGRTSLTAAEPYIHDGRDVTTLPREDCGTASEVEEHDRFAQSDKGSEEFALHIVQFKVCA
jgi:hypothetical protein